MVLTNMFLYPKCFTFLFQTDSSLSLARNQFFVSPVKLAQLPISHFQNFLPWSNRPKHQNYSHKTPFCLLKVGGPTDGLIKCMIPLLYVFMELFLELVSCWLLQYFVCHLSLEIAHFAELNIQRFYAIWQKNCMPCKLSGKTKFSMASCKF